MIFKWLTFFKLIGELANSTPKLKFLELENNYLRKLPTYLFNLVELKAENQNGRLQHIPDYAFSRSRVGSSLLSLNLANNHELDFAPRSLCFNDSSTRTIIKSKLNSLYLDLTVPLSVLNRINKCTLKPLTGMFRRVRLLLDQPNVELGSDSPICSCATRLFLAHFNILIKDICPLFSTYCANQLQFIDDCSSLYQC